MLFKRRWNFWLGMLVLNLIVFGITFRCMEQPDGAFADELILDRRGRTVYIVKPSPYSSSQRVVRDRRGRTKYIIKPSLYGDAEIVTDRKGSRIDEWLWDEGED